MLHGLGDKPDPYAHFAKNMALPQVSTDIGINISGSIGHLVTNDGIYRQLICHWERHDRCLIWATSGMILSMKKVHVSRAH